MGKIRSLQPVLKMALTTKSQIHIISKLHQSSATQELHKYFSSVGSNFKTNLPLVHRFQQPVRRRNKNVSKLALFLKPNYCVCTCAHLHAHLSVRCVGFLSLPSVQPSASQTQLVQEFQCCVYHRTATSSSHSDTFAPSLYWMLNIDGLHEALSSWSALFEKHLYKCQKVHRMSFHFGFSASTSRWAFLRWV